MTKLRWLMIFKGLYSMKELNSFMTEVDQFPKPEVRSTSVAAYNELSIAMDKQHKKGASISSMYTRYKANLKKGGIVHASSIAIALYNDRIKQLWSRRFPKIDMHPDILT